MRSCSNVTVGHYQATKVGATSNLGCKAARSDLSLWLKQPTKLPHNAKSWHAKLVKGTWQMAYGKYPTSLHHSHDRIHALAGSDRDCASATTRWDAVSTAPVLGCKHFADPATTQNSGRTGCHRAVGHWRRCLRCLVAVLGTAVDWPGEVPDSAEERCAGGNHWYWPLMDRVDDLGVVDPKQVRGGDP